MNTSLELPKGILILQSDNPVQQERLARERRPYLVEGYLLRPYTELPQFDFQAIVNCHQTNFLKVLETLVALMPDSISLSMGEYGEISAVEGGFSGNELMAALKRYSRTVNEDINVEFVFDSLSSYASFQLCVSDCKYFEIYTSDSEGLKQAFLYLRIPEVPQLATVSEFPRTMTGQPIEDTKRVLAEIRNRLESKWLSRQ